ncbi:MAG: helix-turn-helix transcriptional regulator [Candidatus Aenigmatarchaeota archaeon]
MVTKLEHPVGSESNTVYHCIGPDGIRYKLEIVGKTEKGLDRIVFGRDDLTLDEEYGLRVSMGFSNGKMSHSTQKEYLVKTCKQLGVDNYYNAALVYMMRGNISVGEIFIINNLDSSPTPEQAKLTDREREVIEYMTAGLDNNAISNKLGCGRNTIKTHVKKIYEKLVLVNGKYPRFKAMIWCMYYNTN